MSCLFSVLLYTAKMMAQTPQLLTLVVICLSCGSFSIELVKQMDQPRKVNVPTQQFGRPELCAPAQLNVTWTPVSPKPDDVLKINWDYTFDEEFSGGILSIVWYTRLDLTSTWQESTALSQQMSCDDVEILLKSSDLNMFQSPNKCPYQKNDKIVGSFQFTNIEAIPFGYNSLVGKGTNQNNHLVFCFNATIYLEIPDYD